MALILCKKKNKVHGVNSNKIKSGVKTKYGLSVNCDICYGNGRISGLCCFWSDGGRAMVVEDKKQILKNFRNMTKKQKAEAINEFAEYAAENVPTAGNMRGSKEYRTLLVKVLTRRAWEAVGGMKNEY